MQISKGTLAFLKDLKANNNRDWFLAHKKDYESAKQEFDGFVEAMIPRIATFEPAVESYTAKDCVMRIYRDVRFSADKSPYKINFGAHVNPAGRKTEVHNKAGYYLHLEPGASFLAGGAYMPEAVWLKAIRAEIHYNGKLFHEILNNPDFKKYFVLEGEKLKTTPKDYPADHPDIELLKHKSFVGMHQIKDSEIVKPDFLDHCTQAFRALKPFNDFLNMSMD